MGLPVDKAYQEVLDNVKYIGHNTQIGYDFLSLMLFTKKTISLIREKVSEYLTGVDEYNRKIIPSDRVIVTALFGVKNVYVPKTGDIYGRFIVVDENLRNDYGSIVDQTISLLVRGISTDLGMIENNNKLSIWTTVLGDFNEHGLRSHPVIKTRDRRPDPYLFNMKY